MFELGIVEFIGHFAQNLSDHHSSIFMQSINKQKIVKSKCEAVFTLQFACFDSTSPKLEAMLGRQVVFKIFGTLWRRPQNRSWSGRCVLRIECWRVRRWSANDAQWAEWTKMTHILLCKCFNEGTIKRILMMTSQIWVAVISATNQIVLNWHHFLNWPIKFP